MLRMRSNFHCSNARPSEGRGLSGKFTARPERMAPAGHFSYFCVIKPRFPLHFSAPLRTSSNGEVAYHPAANFFRADF